MGNSWVIPHFGQTQMFVILTLIHDSFLDHLCLSSGVQAVKLLRKPAETGSSSKYTTEGGLDH
jgi:hypothetical protein